MVLFAVLFAFWLVLGCVIVKVLGFDFETVLVTSVVGIALCFVGSRRVGLTVVFGVLVLFVGFAWLETLNALDFHTLNLGGPPPRFTHCGRDYLLDPTLVGATALIRDTDLRFSDRWSTLVTPSGTRILTFSCQSDMTPTVLHTEPHAGKWFEYTLSGGP